MKNSLTNKSKVFENEVNFNLKGKLSDLGQKEKEKEEIKFEKKLEKIKRNRIGLLCGSVTNNVSRGRTTIIL
jgi:hypothetical protein